MQILFAFFINLAVHGFRIYVGEGDDDRLDGASFLRVDRRQEELVHLMTFVKGMFTFCLLSADDPETASFRFAEGIEPTCRDNGDRCVEDDFYAHRGMALAAMYDLRAKRLVNNQIEIV